MGNNWKCRPKIQNQTTHQPTPYPSLTRDPISTLWNHGGPIGPPKQQCIPPKRSIFPDCPRLWVTTGSVNLKSKVKPPIHPPHPHPSPGTPYQHSGTMGGPIRPPKQQYIPPKQSIFPERPRLWVTTGSAGLKSKVKPKTPSPSVTPIPHQGPHFNNLVPRGAPSDPHNNNTYPQNNPFFLSALDCG